MSWAMGVWKIFLVSANNCKPRLQRGKRDTHQHTRKGDTHMGWEIFRQRDGRTLMSVRYEWIARLVTYVFRQLDYEQVWIRLYRNENE